MKLADFDQAADKELWLCKLDLGCIPVYVMEIEHRDTKVRYWSAWTATELLHEPYMALMTHLSLTGKFSAGRYVLYDDRAAWDQRLDKAPGVTPEYYFTWKEEKKAQKRFAFGPIADEAVELPPPVDEAFLREVVARTQIVSLASVKVIWSAIIQTAMQWLINRNKPINLGFATVYASPYRVNWKAILLGAFPKIWGALSKHGRPQMEKALIDAGFMDALYWKELMEIKRPNHTCGWNLELVPNKLWNEATDRVENLRIAQGQEAYAKFVAKSIQRNLLLSVAAFRAYVARSIAPSAKFSSLAADGQQILIPWTPKGGVSPRSAKSGSSVICADSVLDAQRPRFTTAFPEQIDDVCKLPDARWQVSQLRVSGGYLEESRD